MYNLLVFTNKGYVLMSALPKRAKDITGLTFGSLTAIKFVEIKNRLAYWQYKCKCGNTHIARANTITYETKRNNDPELPSCGCVEMARKTKHGYRTAKNTHPIYRTYRGILDRCYNKNSKHYKWYGAKGVTICDEWLNNPKAFIEWSINNGWSKGLQCDKDILSNKKGINPPIYSPETCQWVKSKTNVSYATNRNNYGKHPNIRLSHTDVREILDYYYNGIFSVKELCKLYNIKSTTSIYRLINADRKG